ncbi:hypothetical protein [Acinetobacter wuhouensis]|uniref:Uncharacterized protein n=1 Tax=Acinetobacter wuhouensis TaxID=1879050 RepID=A0A3G2T2A5_9GAMM|nr:hypothetical protein [Acinetobacter wuhouensis]AYO54383.1 hypothetical protein CDG68_12370 [Acinetobacter wuhouensis]
MINKFENLYLNNQYVDQMLIQSLEGITPKKLRDQQAPKKSSGFVINHPLESMMFREMIKETGRKPNAEFINKLTNYIKY